MKTKIPDDVREYFRSEGARGGTIAGQSMTAAQRKARARKAGKASAAKKKHAKKGPA